jgi:hypothetical protein
LAFVHFFQWRGQPKFINHSLCTNQDTAWFLKVKLRMGKLYF